jgi:hypothetical protein
MPKLSQGIPDLQRKQAGLVELFPVRGIQDGGASGML